MDGQTKEEQSKKAGISAFVKKYWLLLAALLLAAALGGWFGTADLRAYHSAEKLMAQGDYVQAAESFGALEDYKDAPERQKEAFYLEGLRLIEEQSYFEAISQLEKAEGYSDAETQQEKCWYALGLEAMEQEDYETAADCFEKAGEGEEARNNRNLCLYTLGHQLFQEKDFEGAESYFCQLSDEEIEACGYLHFASLEDAWDTIYEKGQALEEEICLYIGNIKSSMSTSEKLKILNITQVPLGNVETDGQLLRITPQYYPGQRILKAHQEGTVENLSQEERQVYELAMEIVEQAKAESQGPFALEVWLHDWLYNHVEYEEGNNEAKRLGGILDLPVYTATGALLNGKANCQGYADAFMLLGNLAGFDVRYQVGKTSAMHMWDAIELDGQWYGVDVTNDYAAKLNEDVPNYYRLLNFAQTDEYMLSENFRPDRLAETRNDEYDYYAVNGLVFDTIEEAADCIVDQYQNEGVTKFTVCVSGEIENEICSSTLKQTCVSRGAVYDNYEYYRWAFNGNTYLLMLWNK